MDAITPARMWIHAVTGQMKSGLLCSGPTQKNLIFEGRPPVSLCTATPLMRLLQSMPQIFCSCTCGMRICFRIALCLVSHSCCPVPVGRQICAQHVRLNAKMISCCLGRPQVLFLRWGCLPERQELRYQCSMCGALSFQAIKQLLSLPISRCVALLQSLLQTLCPLLTFIPRRLRPTVLSLASIVPGMPDLYSTCSLLYAEQVVRCPTPLVFSCQSCILPFPKSAIIDTGLTWNHSPRLPLTGQSCLELNHLLMQLLHTHWVYCRGRF